MSIVKVCRIICFSFLAICVVAIKPTMSTKSSDIDSHLKEYSHYNVTHHDNIDDEPHAHTHKHSEDGEEHEHDHQHTKVTQSEIKLLNNSVKILGAFTIIESKEGFTDKNLISNPHPQSIYRPPIII